MKTIIKLEELKTIDQLDTFLSRIHVVAFSVMGVKEACYRWIQGKLIKFQYLASSRPARRMEIRYLISSRVPSTTCLQFVWLPPYHPFS